MTIDSNPVITLLTDFGIRDSFSGQMKGVILRINPRVTLVDITHSIPPHDIRQGAFILFSAWQAFPPGTIHLCVVDPGVGSDRRGLLMEKDRHYFIGPDNGIFSFLLEHSDSGNHSVSLYSIGKPGTREGVGGDTFHGRDIFAPVAAQLSLGADVSSFGPLAADCVRLQIPRPKPLENGVIGEVIHVDGFGNLITNIPREDLKESEACTVSVGKSLRIERISRTYTDVTVQSALAYWGSAGFLEIGLREGNIAQTLDLNVGCEITLIRKR